MAIIETHYLLLLQNTVFRNADSKNVLIACVTAILGNRMIYYYQFRHRASNCYRATASLFLIVWDRLEVWRITHC